MSSLVFSSRELASITEHQVDLQLFFHGDEKEKLAVGEQGRRTEELVVIDRRGINGFSLRKTEEVAVMEEDEECSSQSSSIGVDTSSSSEEDDEERGDDEVQSKLKDEGPFGSLASLEDSLPIKRGLSNFFAGKSKSFASLSDAACGNARDLLKPENPFNKRRRIQMSCKASWRRRASCSSLITSLPPLLSHDLVVKEGKEEEEEEEERGGDFPLASLHSHGGERGGLRKSFNTHRSFSLSDFQNV